MAAVEVRAPDERPPRWDEDGYLDWYARNVCSCGGLDHIVCSLVHEAI